VTPARGPYSLALLVATGAFITAAVLVELIVPRVVRVQVVSAEPSFLDGVRIALALAALVDLARGWRALTPLRTAPFGAPTRRAAAHDHPLRVAGALILTGVALALTTLGFTLAYGADATDALVASVSVYLAVGLPVLPVHLALRRLLVHEARGREGAGAVPAVRQPVRLRVAMAVQLPVVVCVAALVVVEQSNTQDYARDVSRFYDGQYVDVLERVLRIMPDEVARDALMSDLRPPLGVMPYRATSLTAGDDVVGAVADPHVVRPWTLRVVPIALFVVVALFALSLGAWLSREVTRELRSVREALARVRARPEGQEPLLGPEGAEAGFRETRALVEAFGDALRGFQARRDALDEATAARRASDAAKARFLAHVSHELKSPLNTILGFSEVLLAGMDGPLTPTQTRHLGILWRSGDTLLRFILALLDAARMEASPGRQTASAALTAEAIAQELRSQWRRDPLGRVRLEVEVEPSAVAVRPHLDAPRTVRALALCAGVLIDAVEEGTVEVRLHADGTTLLVDVSLLRSGGVSPDEVDADRRRLRLQLADAETGRSESAAGTACRLFDSLAAQQGGTVERRDTAETDWPAFRFVFPDRAGLDPVLAGPAAVLA
jgi:signal transduction histidine kinase